LGLDFPNSTTEDTIVAWFWMETSCKKMYFRSDAFWVYVAYCDRILHVSSVSRTGSNNGGDPLTDKLEQSSDGGNATGKKASITAYAAARAFLKNKIEWKERKSEIKSRTDGDLRRYIVWIMSIQKMAKESADWKCQRNEYTGTSIKRIKNMYYHEAHTNCTNVTITIFL